MAAFLKLCLLLSLLCSAAAQRVNLQSFAIPDPGEEFRAVVVSGSGARDQVFAATEHYLYRLAANLTELQRKLFTPFTRLLVISNSSESLLICGAECVVEHTHFFHTVWPSLIPQGEPPTVLDHTSNGKEVGFVGILKEMSDRDRPYELTYAQDEFFDARVGMAGVDMASRIVRGHLVRGGRQGMPDRFEVLATQIERNPLQSRRFIHTFSRDTYSYFLSVMSFDGDAVQARIVRICDSDTGFRTGQPGEPTNFTSYVELGLYCGDSSGMPTAAAYVPSPNAFGYDALILSIGVERLSEVRNRLCAFSVPLMDGMMDTKIDECAGGVGDIGLKRDPNHLAQCAIVQVILYLKIIQKHLLLQNITVFKNIKKIQNWSNNIHCINSWLQFMIVSVFFMCVKGDRECNISPLEVDFNFYTNHFLLVSGLDRDSDSFFSHLTATVIDGYTFIFTGNGNGEIQQVKGQQINSM